MIAILWTARNGPHPVLKTRARARRVAAEGADVMVMQSRGGACRNERFQICLKSAVRLERRDGEITRGCCSIDTVPTVSAIARGTPRCKLRCSWFLRRNSSERLGAAIFKIRVDALADSVRTEHRPVRFGRLPSCHRGCAVEGG